MELGTRWKCVFRLLSDLSDLIYIILYQLGLYLGACLLWILFYVYIIYSEDVINVIRNVKDSL